MKRVIKTLCSMLLVTAMTVGIYPMTATAAADSPAEYCVPVLKQYTTDTGTWKPSEGTRFYIVVSDANAKADDELVEMMYTVAKEFVAKGYTTCTQVVYGTESAALSTDFLIKQGETGVPSSVRDGIKDQSYKIKIDSQRATITYRTNVGAFYAFTTILQVLTYTNNAMPCGTIVDYPDTVTRSAFIDIARKYYTPAWLENYIKELSWYKINEITLHLSENIGMRLESTTYPGLAGGNNTTEGKGKDSNYITQAQMTNIVETAFEYQVDVVPSFDVPGHVNYVLGRFMEDDSSITWDGKTGLGNVFNYNGATKTPNAVSTNGVYGYRTIDITNATAREIFNNLLTEFGTFFHNLGCTKFNIGGDELFGWTSFTLNNQEFSISGKASTSGTLSLWFANTHWANWAKTETGNANATAYDAFIYYMNSNYELMTKLGYTEVRMFSDEVYPVGSTGHTQTLNKNIVICCWANGVSYFGDLTAYQNTHKFINCMRDNLYYVLKATPNNDFKNASAANLYNYWQGSMFYDATTGLLSNQSAAKRDTDTVYTSSETNNIGSCFLIWCDQPSLKTEATVYSEVMPWVRSFATKSWNVNSNKSLTYDEFQSVYNKIGQAPLYNKTSTATIPKIIHGDTKTTVTVKYYLDSKLDSNGTVTLSGYNGHPYSADVKSIPNYAYTGCSGGEITGTFADTDIIISLYYVKIDKSSLQNYVDRFIPSSFAKNESDYDGYLDAYYAAKAVLEKSAPTGDEIDSAIENLKVVINNMKRKQVCITIEHYDQNGKKIQDDTKMWVEMSTNYDITTQLVSGRSVKYTIGSQMGYISATPITIKVTYN